MAEFRTRSIVIAATVLAAAVAMSPSSPAQPCEPNLAQAEAVLELHRLDRGMPGAALAVFDGAGTNHLETYLGSYDASTYVPIASASKTVSAAVIMSLVDDGTMSLDDKVSDYLPQSLGTDDGEITVRQAFSQTSGLWNEAWPCVGDRDARLDECVLDILDDAPRISPPGETFFYGSNSMHVADEIPPDWVMIRDNYESIWTGDDRSNPRPPAPPLRHAQRPRRELPATRTP